MFEVLWLGHNGETEAGKTGMCPFLRSGRGKGQSVLSPGSVGLRSKLDELHFAVDLGRGVGQLVQPQGRLGVPRKRQWAQSPAWLLS
jgi:hypothetical protein